MKEYIFPCGHNNGFKDPIYPFDWVCNVCKTKHSYVLKKVFV